MLKNWILVFILLNQVGCLLAGKASVVEEERLRERYAAWVVSCGDADDPQGVALFTQSNCNGREIERVDAYVACLEGDGCDAAPACQAEAELEDNDVRDCALVDPDEVVML